MHSRHLLALLIGLLSLTSSRLGGDELPARDTAAESTRRASRELPGLHNVLPASSRIYSGSEPRGEAGFRSIAQLNVRTIVSVDGARPNLKLARKFGLRYVHIPIGYEGISPAAGKSLARLVREVDGPIYIHCHHGRHRGPAAAAVALVAAGDSTHQAALELLERAGTSRDYAGLWRDVAAFRPPPKDAPLPPLVAVADVGSLAASMALIDRRFDDLKRCREARWSMPGDHPDLEPQQQALLLREAFHEAGRHLADELGAQFADELRDSETLARQIEQALRSGKTAAAERSFGQLQDSCQRCHARFRN